MNRWVATSIVAATGIVFFCLRELAAPAAQQARPERQQPGAASAVQSTRTATPLAGQFVRIEHEFVQVASRPLTGSAVRAVNPTPRARSDVRRTAASHFV